jgi:diguanylate cyclase (GGDEF)-like protein
MDSTKVLDDGTVPHPQPSPAASVADTGQAADAAGGPERSRWATVAIVAYSSALALGAVALLLWGPLDGASAIKTLVPQWEMFAAFCVLWAAANWATVSVHHRGNTGMIALDGVPLVIGLVFLRPSLLVLGCAISETIVFVVVHRSPLIRVFFNTASTILSVAVATVVFRELLAGHSPVSLRGWAAIAVAVCTKELLATLNFQVVTRLNGQAPEGRTGSQITTHLMFLAAALCLAIVVLDALWFSLRTTVPLILVAALIITAYRGYTRLTLRFGSLQRLYDFSRALGTANLEPSSMSVEVLRQVCTVMRARRAQLILAEPSGLPRRISLNDDVASEVELINLDDTSFITQAISSSTSSLQISPNARQHTTSHDPLVGEYTAAIVAPLVNQNTTIGAIVAIDRDEESDEFDQDDLRLFDTLVAHASSNLERARLVEELRYEVESKSHQATHDMLTGLPNRVLFVTRATDALAHSKAVAIVLLDLDRFKEVNDTLGHAIGDRLLCEVADRLLRGLPGNVTVARLGGDEFAFVIPDVVDAPSALERVNELHALLAHPIEIDGLTHAVSASAGIALAPMHGDDVALLLQRADIAMYLAKERRSVAELYSVEHDTSMRRKLMLTGLLTQALESKSQLSVVYQPVADVRSRQVVQVEALSRWHHPELGPIPPDEFIAIAEQMGMINQISDFVLSEACAAAAKWRRVGLNLNVAINVSGRELLDGKLVDRVKEPLRLNGLPASAITLEVTETEAMADPIQATRILEELASLGVSIAIDDYGTGHSSLTYLHSLPAKKLKIDRSFVTNLPNEHSNRVIVHATIEMAHRLGLTVVAEGAEDDVTCALLAEAGCDLIQGYYLSRPLPPDTIEEWLLGGAMLEFTPLRKDDERTEDSMRDAEQFRSMV